MISSDLYNKFQISDLKSIGEMEILCESFVSDRSLF